jgi:hypothetical protein
MDSLNNSYDLFPNIFLMYLFIYSINVAAESDHESTESDEDFYMCQICNTEEVTFYVSISTANFSLLVMYLVPTLLPTMVIFLLSHQKLKTVFVKKIIPAHVNISLLAISKSYWTFKC